MLSLYLCYLFVAVSLAHVGSYYAPIECGKYEFSCNNGQCINKELWCNDVKDCYDGSDERHCKTNEKDLKPKACPPYFFRCNNGGCIPMSGRCDGIDSCGDSSDEHNCSREGNVTSGSKVDLLHPATKTSKPLLKAHPGVNYANGFQDDEEPNNYTIDSYQFKKQEKEARNWLLSLRKDDYGWDDDTARVIVALSLSTDGLHKNVKEDMLMIKQFHLQLSIALARNETRMDLSDLALCINALQGSCGEPRNFYGFDLVSKLRDAVDNLHRKGEYAMPLIYMILCLNNASSNHDINILYDLFLSRDEFADKKDILALVLLTTICMKTHSQHRTKELSSFQTTLVDKISENLSGNVYEVALIFQALEAAEVHPPSWNRDEVVDFILNHQDSNGSFGDILATYYILPILSGKSLLFSGRNCFESQLNDLTPIEVLGNAKNQIHVSFSLYFENPTKMSQTVLLSLPDKTTVFDMMRLAQEKNRNYRFSLDERKDIPSVYSISGIPNDAEKGIYWVLYTKERSTHQLVQVKESIKKRVLANHDNIIFWWMPILKK